MGLFSKKKKKQKKELNFESKELTYDRMLMEMLESDDDKYLTNLAEQMMRGNPLILNFERLDVDQANKVIAFFSGVAFAIQGEILLIKDIVFMFANKDVYLDGSMEEFIKDFVE